MFLSHLLFTLIFWDGDGTGGGDDKKSPAAGKSLQEAHGEKKFFLKKNHDQMAWMKLLPLVVVWMPPLQQRTDSNWTHSPEKRCDRLLNLKLIFFPFWEGGGRPKPQYLLKTWEVTTNWKFFVCLFNQFSLVCWVFFSIRNLTGHLVFVCCTRQEVRNKRGCGKEWRYFCFFLLEDCVYCTNPKWIFPPWTRNCNIYFDYSY